MKPTLTAHTDDATNLRAEGALILLQRVIQVRHRTKGYVRDRTRGVISQQVDGDIRCGGSCDAEVAFSFSG
jgi:hypothetical protein